MFEIDQEEEKNTIVGVLYRAHISIDNYITDISATFETISNENKTCYIMGDFNTDLLKEEVYRRIRDYLNLLLSNSFLPKIVKPTRITPTIAILIDIDNMLTTIHDDDNSFITITVISEHFPTVISTKLKFRKNINVNSEPIYKRSFSDGDIYNLKQKLLSVVKWNEILDGRDADEDYNKFIKVCHFMMNVFFEGRSSRLKEKGPIYNWITKGLLKSLKTKNELHKECKKLPTERRITKFMEFRSRLHNLIRTSKRKFYEKKFQKSKNYEENLENNKQHTRT